MNGSRSILWGIAAIPAIGLIALPLAALVNRAGAHGFLEALRREETQSAIMLTMRTSAIALLAIVVMGFPLACFIAKSESWFSKLVDTLSDLPIVLPPAAAGIALLAAFGRSGWLGGPLSEMGINVVFTSSAVVIAQCFVGLPFFVRSFAEGLRTVNKESISAAEIDGATTLRSLWSVILPQCQGAFLAGLLLAWARALGEFGATLMFAGNFVGRTQTMPLAIYAGFESDLDTAIALSTILLILAATVLVIVKVLARRQP